MEEVRVGHIYGIPCQQGPIYSPAPIIGVSPMRPSHLPVIPPVEVAAARRPLQSMATAPTVSESCITQ